MGIKEFLDNKPTVSQILEYVETEARCIAKERQRQAQDNRRAKAGGK